MAQPPLDATTQRLLSTHGELIGGNALMHCLGFRTARAYQAAIKSGRLPIPTFEVPGRRGRFARSVEVARWLNALGTAPDLRADRAPGQ